MTKNPTGENQGPVVAMAPAPGDLTIHPDTQEEPSALLNFLHELRAEVQDLQSVLNSVRSGQAPLKSQAAIIRKTLEDIEPIQSELEDPDCPDLIRHIQNAWERVRTCPLIDDPQGTYEAQEQMSYLEMCEEQLNKIVFLIGQRTIPARVNNWLGRSRPGYYLPFNLVFEDELPSPDDRQKVLNYLAWAPQVVENGIVDPNQGLIYRYAKNRNARFRSQGLVIFIFILFSALVVGSCFLSNILPSGSWPLAGTDLGMMVAGWLAVSMGVLVHLAVGSVKRSKQNGGLPAVLAIDDLPLVIDARKGQIILKMFLAFLGLFFLVIATGIEKMSIISAFLVGYSLDSFVEMFGSSLEQQSQALAGTIKQELGL